MAPGKNSASKRDQQSAHEPDRSSFEGILAQMNAEGEFTSTVLASEEGLPIAAAPFPPPYDVETTAAMVAMVKEFILQTQARLGLARVDEVSIVVGDRSRLICRYFTMGSQLFVLTVIAPPNHSYRRLTSRAIHELQQVWNEVETAPA